MNRAVSAVLLAGALLLACSSEGGAAAPFRQSCEQRVAWSKSSDAACLRCLSAAELEPCACLPGQPGAGACVDLGRRRLQACGSEASDCTLSCTDCSCLERCQSSQGCTDAATALEDCLVRTCRAYCR